MGIMIEQIPFGIIGNISLILRNFPAAMWHLYKG